MDRDGLKLLQEKVTLLRSEGKYKETIESSYELLEQGKQFLDYKSILTSYINTAVSYYCIGDMEKALTSIELYDQICDKHGDEIDKLNLYNTLFLIYEYNKNLDKAKLTLEKTIELGKKLEKYNIVSNAYSNYSHILIYEENFKAALEMGQLGLEMAGLHQPYSLILEIRVKLNIIGAYIGLKDFETAKLLIEEIRNFKALDSFIREKAQFQDLQGEWNFNQKKYSEAYIDFTLAKEIVESYNDLYLLKEIQEKRCKTCELMGDITLGFKIQKEYILLLKAINKQELEVTALKLDIKHDITVMERKANTDYLTGLYNKKYLEETTNQWLNQKSFIREDIVLIVFDIDDFKNINDKYGHLTGDEVIKQIGKSCSTIIREEDLIGRYGGDEFVIVLRGSSVADGKEIAERIKNKLSKLKVEDNGKIISVKASIGLSHNSKAAIKDFNELFRLADIELYKVKQSGKNKISIL